MRKARFGLGLVVTAGAGGFLAASLGPVPAVALAAILCLVVGFVTFTTTGIERLALVAVGLLVLTITWNGIRIGGASASTNSVTGGGRAFGDVILVFAALGVLAYAIGRKRSLPLPAWVLLPGIGCILSFILTIVFPPGIKVIQHAITAETTLAQLQGITGSVQPIGIAQDTITLIEYELALVVIPVLIAAIATTPRRCRLLLDLFVTGAIINAFAGLLNYMGIALPLTRTAAAAGQAVGTAASDTSRAVGLTIHPNYLALVCVIALPMVTVWFGRTRRFTIASVVGMAALLGGVFVAGSRAGGVAAVIALVAAFALVPRLRAALPYLLPLLIMAMIPLLIFTRVGHSILHQLRLTGSRSASGSNYDRSILAHAAWAQIKVRPIEGVGWTLITGAHDIYLELLDAGGVIVLVSFIVFIGGLVSSLVRGLSGPLRDEAIVCGIAILAWLVNGIFDNQVGDKYLYVVPGLLFAIGRTTWLLRANSAPRAVAVEPRVTEMLPSRRPLVGAGAR